MSSRIDRFWRVRGRYTSAEIFEGGHWVPAARGGGDWVLCHKLAADMKKMGQLNCNGVIARLEKPSGSDDWSELDETTVDKRWRVSAMKIVREEREIEIDDGTGIERMLSQTFVTEAVMGDA